jgi:hypothetical protein
VTMRSTPGSALPVVRKVRLPGINLMTLLIKTAGGRESVMVHLGRGDLIPERSGDRYPTEFNFESLRSFRGNPARMQLSTDGVCIELLIPGWRFAQAFELCAARYRWD